MFTIVASSTTMSWAVPRRASTCQRLGSARVCEAGATVDMAVGGYETATAG